ncbi:MAG: transcriptional repressor LexA [Planctomycetota bacterium]
MYYTDRQLAILEFLQRYRQMRTVSPTLQEIAEHFAVSKVTIHDHVQQLERKGAVRRAAHRARSLEVLDPEYQDRAHPAAAASTAGNERLPMTVLGVIAAGQPIEAIEVPEVIDLAEMLVPSTRRQHQDHYALRVRGDSMIDDGIHDGDLVIVERRSVADDGEVVVAVLDDDVLGAGVATLKRLFRETRDGKTVFRLQPANAALAPLFTDRVEVRGVVVGVVRSFK